MGKTGPGSDVTSSVLYHIAVSSAPCRCACMERMGPSHEPSRGYFEEDDHQLDTDHIDEEFDDSRAQRARKIQRALHEARLRIAQGMGGSYYGHPDQAPHEHFEQEGGASHAHVTYDYAGDYDYEPGYAEAPQMPEEGWEYAAAGDYDDAPAAQGHYYSGPQPGGSNHTPHWSSDARYEMAGGDYPHEFQGAQGASHVSEFAASDDYLHGAGYTHAHVQIHAPGAWFPPDSSAADDAGGDYAYQAPSGQSYSPGDFHAHAESQQYDGDYDSRYASRASGNHGLGGGAYAATADERSRHHSHGFFSDGLAPRVPQPPPPWTRRHSVDAPGNSGRSSPAGAFSHSGRRLSVPRFTLPPSRRLSDPTPAPSARSRGPNSGDPPSSIGHSRHVARGTSSAAPSGFSPTATILDARSAQLTSSAPDPPPVVAPSPPVPPPAPPPAPPAPVSVPDSTAAMLESGARALQAKVDALSAEASKMRETQVSTLAALQSLHQKQQVEALEKELTRQKKDELAALEAVAARIKQQRLEEITEATKRHTATEMSALETAALQRKQEQVMALQAAAEQLKQRQTLEIEQAAEQLRVQQLADLEEAAARHKREQEASVALATQQHEARMRKLAAETIKKQREFAEAAQRRTSELQALEAAVERQKQDQLAELEATAARLQKQQLTELEIAAARFAQQKLVELEQNAERQKREHLASIRTAAQRYEDELKTLKDEAALQREAHTRNLAALTAQLRERERRDAAEVLRYASELNRAATLHRHQMEGMQEARAAALSSSPVFQSPDFSPVDQPYATAAGARTPDARLRRFVPGDGEMPPSSSLLQSLLGSMAETADRVRQQHLDALHESAVNHKRREIDELTAAASHLQSRLEPASSLRPGPPPASGFQRSWREPSHASHPAPGEALRSEQPANRLLEFDELTAAAARLHSQLAQTASPLQPQPPAGAASGFHRSRRDPSHGDRVSDSGSQPEQFAEKRRPGQQVPRIEPATPSPPPPRAEVRQPQPRSLPDASPPATARPRAPAAGLADAEADKWALMDRIFDSGKQTMDARAPENPVPWDHSTRVESTGYSEVKGRLRRSTSFSTLSAYAGAPQRRRSGGASVASDEDTSTLDPFRPSRRPSADAEGSQPPRDSMDASASSPGGQSLSAASPAAAPVSAAAAGLASTPGVPETATASLLAAVVAMMQQQQQQQSAGAASDSRSAAPAAYAARAAVPERGELIPTGPTSAQQFRTAVPQQQLQTQRSQQLTREPRPQQAGVGRAATGASAIPRAVFEAAPKKPVRDVIASTGASAVRPAASTLRSEPSTTRGAGRAALLSPLAPAAEPALPEAVNADGYAEEFESDSDRDGVDGPIDPAERSSRRAWDSAKQLSADIAKSNRRLSSSRHSVDRAFGGSGGRGGYDVKRRSSLVIAGNLVSQSTATGRRLSAQ